jgi:preprotein translocase subunit YajC
MQPQDLFVLAALALVIFFMFTSNKKRKKQAAELSEQLKTGAYVMLHSGIYGEVVEINEDKLVIESTPGNKLVVARGAVRGIVEAPAKKVAAKKPAAKKPVAKAPAKPAAKKPASK